MANALSISASVLAIVAAAFQTTKSLNGTVNRYKGRDKTLQRLQGELEDLLNILGTLEATLNSENSVLYLLKGPLSRCSQLCHDFEISMVEFNGKSKPGSGDWAKMEFMRGDINDFTEVLAGYKATISVALGTVTMLVPHLIVSGLCLHS
jgi:chromosome segregation ATPase